MACSVPPLPTSSANGCASRAAVRAACEESGGARGRAQWGGAAGAWGGGPSGAQAR